MIDEVYHLHQPCWTIKHLLKSTRFKLPNSVHLLVDRELCVVYSSPYLKLKPAAAAGNLPQYCRLRNTCD